MKFKKFKKGDLLSTKRRPVAEAVARVEKVTRDGVVHCTNLLGCATMDEGVEFHFIQDEHTWYVLYSRK